MPDELAKPELAVEVEGGHAVAPGTSRRVTIKLPRSDVQQLVEFDVTDDEGHSVQSQRFRTLEGVDAVHSFIQAPPELAAGKLNFAVRVVPAEDNASALELRDSVDVET